MSLDFELMWGVRDRSDAGRSEYRANLLGARQAIPSILQLFREFNVSATWATVGLLFADSRAMVNRFVPTLRPRYDNRGFDAYREPLGDGEASDPLHYGSELIRLIGETPGQEIGTHTFCHYFCLEDGQSIEDFREDMKAAARIARERGIVIRSIVFPRNQVNPNYFGVLAECGVQTYRGAAPGAMYCTRKRSEETVFIRGSRWLDSYFNLGSRTAPWTLVTSRDGLCNVPAGLFLRPVSTRFFLLNYLHRRRLLAELIGAARRQEICHLWWHPHNFGVNLAENMAFLRRILMEFMRCRERYGMVSMGMHEAARTALAMRPEPETQAATV